MITDVSYGLSLQLTRKLVNLSTRKLQIMITDVSCGLSLQLTRQLVNLSTRQLQIMITDVSCNLSLQVTCSLVYSFLCYHVFLTSNLSTCLLVLMLPCLPYKQLVNLSTR